MKVGVIVGRFQVPRLHPGHRYLIDEACKRFDKVLVFVGVTKYNKLTSHDPLPFEARKIMLLEHNPNLIIYPIKDIGDWVAWIDKLNEMIGCACTLEYLNNPEIFIFGSRDSVVDNYKKSPNGIYNTMYLESLEDYSGTIERDKIINQYHPIWNYESRALLTWFSGNI